MKEKESAKLKKTGLAALFWVALALAVISGSTYAWFTFRTDTNVGNFAGTIGGEDEHSELLISDSAEGPFSDYIELPMEGSAETMAPVSTADLRNWYEAVSNNSEGICNRFREVTEKINGKTICGKLYLKASGKACDVYFDPGAVEFTGDAQMLASCRFGLTVTSGEGTENLIFHLNDFLTETVVSQETTAESRVVIASADSSGNAEFKADPAMEFTPYFARVEGETVYAGSESLCHIDTEEVVTLEYRIYMEGCDENSTKDAQDKEIRLKLGFAGAVTE